MQPLAGTTAVTRQTFWQIGPAGRALFYYLAAVAIALFLYGVYDRFARYARGGAEPIDRFDDLGSRILRTAVLVGSNVAQFDRHRYAGAMHTAAFWGFLVLFVGTVILAIDMDVWTAILGRPSFFVGDFYRSYSFVMDAFGAVFVVGLGMALLARYWFDTPRLHGPHTDLEDDLFVWTLFLLGTGGFLLEGVRLLARGFPSHEVVSFVGLTVAIGLDGIGVSPELATALYPPLWWSHAVLALAFVAAIPYAKPVHMLTSFANVLTRDSKAGQRLPRVPEDAGPADIGVSDVEDFTWKQLLDHDACTNCGRCSSACPATAVGRPLDPRDVILDLRAYGRDRQAGRIESRDVVSADGSGVVDAAAMESCMSCLACVDVCPVDIEHVTQFTRLNRRLTESGQLEESVQETMMNLFKRGNVFGEPDRRRADWTEALDFDVPDARETAVEYLWIVGDYPSYDARNRQVAVSLAHCFDAADVSYGILYEDERNDGNDVRRVGEEGLFEHLAEENVDTMESVEFETIVTTDPHAFNTFKNEYEQFGWDRSEDVKHYTQVLEELVLAGDLPLAGTELDLSVTYHDPCHLGRYNDEYDAPRNLLVSTGATLAEMPRNRRDAFCCGGGGGGLWMDPEGDQKPAEERLREAVEETDGGADLEQFVVACPGCVTMFEDGAKTGGFADDLEVVDLAELVWAAVDGGDVSE